MMFVLWVELLRVYAELTYVIMIMQLVLVYQVQTTRYQSFLKKGYGKRTPAAEYPVKGRGGKGIKTANITEKNGLLAGVIVISKGKDIMVITTDGIMIRFKTKDVSQTGRSTMGVRLIKVNDDSQVASLTIVPSEADQDQVDDEDDNDDNGN